EIGLQQLVGERFAFVNFTEGFLTGRLAFPRGLDQLVVEVLEDVPATDEVMRGLAELREQGHLIALDDFVPGGKHMRLLPCADLVKLDFRALDEQRFVQIAKSLKSRGLDVVAEKLESQEEFEFCRELDVDYFQGYFLAKPKTVHGKSIPTNSLAVMNLMAEFRRPDVELEDIHQLVSRDVSLAFKLLKHINSSLYGLRQEVASVREAVTYLGLDRVQNLVSLFALSSLSDRPALVEIAMQRARMAERMAHLSGSRIADQHFTVGLFSCLEALVGAPMDSLLERLPLTQGISDALLRGAGELGAGLTCVLAYERGEWERVAHPALGPAQLRQCFLEAIAWTTTCIAAEARAA
ncbi:MAG: EAL and HDOD domain-containing protein, partial [Planctomycetota bacterium]